VRRGLVLLVSVALVALTACSGDDPPPFGPDAGSAALQPYEGLGTWVDAFDYAPSFQSGALPAVTPDAVDDMAGLGVQTLYLQASKDDARSPEAIVDTTLVGEFLTRAHEHEMRVVAWYLPTLGNIDADFAHIEALHEFEVDGQRFDSIALDIEWTEGVPYTSARNQALVRLSRRTRALVGDDAALGAIVFPPVQTEVINPVLWPDFPYGDLAPLYDVWMPMAYWTFREGEYRDPVRYTEESIERLRNNLDDPDAAMHPIGGIGDLATPGDYEAFMHAVRETDSIGWSIYDYATSASTSWARLVDE